MIGIKTILNRFGMVQCQEGQEDVSIDQMDDLEIDEGSPMD
jgi:hypothetical protein